MDKRDFMSFFVPVAIIVFAGIVGIASISFTKHDDGPVEEMAEEVIDMQCEKLLGGDCDNIDLSPDSIELGEVARMKLIDDCKTYCDDKEMNE